MKRSLILVLVLFLCLLSWSTIVLAQSDSGENSDEEPLMAYSEYTVKGYSLSVFGGTFSGAQYLENKVLPSYTVLTEGAADVVSYDGGILIQSRDIEHYEAAHKEIKAGESFGVRLGIYIADQFHIDLSGTYSTGQAVTSMLYKPEPDDPSLNVRQELDFDDDFKVFMGGINLMYDAKPASKYGIMPRLGFGIGGIINRFSHLEDKTGLYIQGNFGLEYEIFKSCSIQAQADLAVFAFDVDELVYSTMVNYTTLSIGVKWFIDVIPEPVRASHTAQIENE